MAKLTNEELNAELKSIPGWQPAAGQLKKQYAFKDFVTAIAFVNKVAEIAEQLAHHPDIIINYSRVTLSTSTHSEGSVITMKDVELARRVEQVYEQVKS